MKTQPLISQTLSSLLLCAPMCVLAQASLPVLSADAAVGASAPAIGNTLWSARAGGYRPLGSYGLGSSLNDDGVGATLVRQPDGSLSVFSSMVAPQAYQRGSTSVPWCAESSGLLRIGSLGQECLMQGMLQFELPGQVASAQAGVNFNGGNWDVTLSYGLSWLMKKLDLSDDAQPAAPNPFDVQTSLANSINLVDARAHGLALGAQWRLTPESALQLNAALNQLRVQSVSAMPGLNVNEAQAGLGVVYGSFTGNLIGHVQRAYGPTIGDNRATWGGLDLGVSWRTPWSGELSVGARNLVTKGEDVLLPAPQSNNSLDRTSARTPYVRYKQDL